MGGWPGERSLELLLHGNSQKFPGGSFSFGKILLLNPAAPLVQGRACPLAQPTSPARPGTVWVRAPQGPTLNSPQPAPRSPWVYQFILIPLPMTSSNQVSHSAGQALFGRGGSY